MASSRGSQHSQVHIRTLSAQEARQALPVRVRQLKRPVAGIDTSVVVQAYADQTLVLVSQTGKVGSLTQVHMQRRPSQPASSLAALDLDDDAEPFSVRGAPAAAASATVASSSAMPLGFDSASLLGSCSLQRLLGTHPPGHRSLYDLYSIHIAARAQHASSSSSFTSQSAIAVDASTPVIVGLALKRQSPIGEQQIEPAASTDDDDDDDFAHLAESERERFVQILDLVDEACRL